MPQLDFYHTVCVVGNLNLKALYKIENFKNLKEHLKTYKYLLKLFKNSF